MSRPPVVPLIGRKRVPRDQCPHPVRRLYAIMRRTGTGAKNRAPVGDGTRCGDCGEAFDAPYQALWRRHHKQGSLRPELQPPSEAHDA